MRLSNFVRSALASAVIAMLTGCSIWPLAPPAATPLVTQPRSDVPFTITEPDIYQAEIVITTSGSERRIFTARNGALRVIKYDNGSPNEMSVLTTDADYVVSAASRSYAKRPAGAGFGDEGLATRLLNTRPHAEFEDLGMIDGLHVWRVRTDGDTASDATVYIDESLGLAVREEYHSIAPDGSRTLEYKVELQGIKLEADDALFRVPAGYREVTPEDFARRRAR
jgi:hypothetical protein